MMNAGGERSVEQELLSLENECMQAIVENNMELLERVVGQEYTLAANGLPGKTRFSRQEWMDIVPGYDIHFYELRDCVVHAYGDTAIVLADLALRATVRGADRSGVSTLTDVWVRRDGRWQIVVRSSVFTPGTSDRR